MRWALSGRVLRVGLAAGIVAAIGMAAWSARRVGGSVHFRPAEYRFDGPLAMLSEHDLTLTLENGTGQTVHVMGASSFCGPDGCAKIKGFPQVVPPGGRCRIEVHFEAGGPGPFAHDVPIYTDCPEQPEVIMRIVGEVLPAPSGEVAEVRNDRRPNSGATP